MTNLKRLFRTIDKWARTEFPEAHFKEHADREKYRYGSILWIERIWTEGGLMVVDAAVQYSIGHGAEISPISLQIDSDFRIVGFDASKVRVWKGRASSSADA